MKKIINDKLLMLKTTIVILGALSLICIFTSNIYIYSHFTIKAFDIRLWLAIVIWLIFIVLVIILTKKMINDEKNPITKIKFYLKNISLLLMLTLILIYKVGNGIIDIYKLNNNIFNIIIYILFGTIFISYFVIIFIINKKYLGK